MFGDTNLLLWCFTKYRKLNYLTALCTRLHHHALYRPIRTQSYLFWLQRLPPVSRLLPSLAILPSLSMHLIIYFSNIFQCYNKHLSIHTYHVSYPHNFLKIPFSLFLQKYMNSHNNILGSIIPSDHFFPCTIIGSNMKVPVLRMLIHICITFLIFFPHFIWGHYHLYISALLQPSSQLQIFT